MKSALDTVPVTDWPGTKTANWSVNHRINGYEVVREARKYLGAPYEIGGRSIDGLDCVGLIVCIARDLGFKWQCDTPSVSRDGTVEWGEVESILFYSGLRRISAAESQQGDVVILKTLLGGAGTVKIISATGGMTSFFGVSKFINFVEPTFLVETILSAPDMFTIKRELKMDVQEYIKRLWRIYRYPFVS